MPVWPRYCDLCMWYPLLYRVLPIVDRLLLSQCFYLHNVQKTCYFFLFLFIYVLSDKVICLKKVISLLGAPEQKPFWSKFVCSDFVFSDIKCNFFFLEPRVQIWCVLDTKKSWHKKNVICCEVCYLQGSLVILIWFKFIQTGMPRSGTKYSL